MGWSFLIGDEAEEFFLYSLWDFDESGAFSHDISLLDPASSSDVVADGCPLCLLYNQVLSTFVEYPRYGILLL